MGVAVRALPGEEIAANLDHLAQLRISVFAAFPYLYDGDLSYEAEYIREFAAEPGSVLIAAYDGDMVVGAATASPMWAQKPEFRQPFEDRGYDSRKIFYFGESVLLPQYRGAGIGHAFFDHREEAAAAQGASICTFAAVIRPDNHPARPKGYRPLDGFWRKRDYEPVPGLVAQLSWKEHGDDAESDHQLQYWMREL